MAYGISKDRKQNLRLSETEANLLRTIIVDWLMARKGVDHIAFSKEQVNRLENRVIEITDKFDKESQFYDTVQYHSQLGVNYDRASNE